MGNPKNTTSAPNFVPSVSFFLLAGLLAWLLSVVPYDQVVLDILAMCAVASAVMGILTGLSAGQTSD